MPLDQMSPHQAHAYLIEFKRFYGQVTPDMLAMRAAALEVLADNDFEHRQDVDAALERCFEANRWGNRND